MTHTVADMGHPTCFKRHPFFKRLAAARMSRASSAETPAAPTHGGTTTT